jgi:hypothetical protein
MVASLERRIAALESLPAGAPTAARPTDRELLAIIAPDHVGPMPPRDQLPAMIHAWLTRPGLAEPAPVDGLSARERYLRMLSGPITGGAHGITA